MSLSASAAVTLSKIASFTTIAGAPSHRPRHETCRTLTILLRRTSPANRASRPCSSRVAAVQVAAHVAAHAHFGARRRLQIEMRVETRDALQLVERKVETSRRAREVRPQADSGAVAEWRAARRRLENDALRRVRCRDCTCSRLDRCLPGENSCARRARRVISELHECSAPRAVFDRRPRGPGAIVLSSGPSCRPSAPKRHRHAAATPDPARAPPSSCHGSVRPVAGSRILQTEYTTWVVQDKHAKATSVLSNPVSLRMARILGLPARTPRRSAWPATRSTCPRRSAREIVYGRRRELRGVSWSGQWMARTAHDARLDARAVGRARHVRHEGCRQAHREVRLVPHRHGGQVGRSRDDRRRPSGSGLRSRSVQRRDAAPLADGAAGRSVAERPDLERRPDRSASRRPRARGPAREGPGERRLAGVRGARLLRLPSQPDAPGRQLAPGARDTPIGDPATSPGITRALRWRASWRASPIRPRPTSSRPRCSRFAAEVTKLQGDRARIADRTAALRETLDALARRLATAPVDRAGTIRYARAITDDAERIANGGERSAEQAAMSLETLLGVIRSECRGRGRRRRRRAALDRLFQQLENPSAYDPRRFAPQCCRTRPDVRLKILSAVSPGSSAGPSVPGILDVRSSGCRPKHVRRPFSSLT